MPDKPRSPILVTLAFDPDEMARRGRLGGLATRARHDPTTLTKAGRAAFLSRFATPEERSAYFRDLASKSAAARRMKRAPPEPTSAGETAA